MKERIDMANIVEYGMDELGQMAEAILKSGLFELKTKEQVLTLLMLSQAEGIHPVMAVRRYHIIQGKPSMRADTMLAEFQRRGGKIHWKNIGKDGVEARAVFEIDGQAVEYFYSMAEANKAGLVRGGSGWSKFPDAMLRARVISGGIRMICPEVVAGIYTPEEVSDFQPATAQRQNITPPKDVVDVVEPPQTPRNGTKDAPQEKPLVVEGYREFSAMWRAMGREEKAKYMDIINGACDDAGVSDASQLSAVDLDIMVKAIENRREAIAAYHPGEVAQ